MFSKERSNHIRQLKLVLERCRKCGILLNPKESVFGVDEGKLLGYLISKEGVKIDPMRISEDSFAIM